MSDPFAITPEDVEEAARRIEGHEIGRAHV